jgi:hypothetical protein
MITDVFKRQVCFWAEKFAAPTGYYQAISLEIKSANNINFYGLSKTSTRSAQTPPFYGSHIKTSSSRVNNKTVSIHDTSNKASSLSVNAYFHLKRFKVDAV